MSYIVGQVATLSASFVDDAGDPINPTTVTLRIQVPDGTETAYVYGTDVDLIRDSTGEYHRDYELTTKGVYFWRWEADGNVVGADEGYLFVKRTQFVLP